MPASDYWIKQEEKFIKSKSEDIKDRYIKRFGKRNKRIKRKTGWWVKRKRLISSEDKK